MNKNRLIQISMLALLFLGVLSTLPIAKAITLFSETFEDDTTGTAPSGSGYTYSESGGSTNRVSTVVARTGIKSGLITQAASGGTNYLASSTNLCSGDVVNLWFYFSSLPSSGNSIYFDIVDSPNTLSQASGVYVTSSGQLVADTTSSGVYTTLATGISTGTWYDMAIGMTCSNPSILNVASSVLGISFSYTSTQNYGGKNLRQLRIAGGGAHGDESGGCNGCTVYVDDIGTAGSPVAPGQVVSENWEGYSNAAVPTTGTGYTTTSVTGATAISTTLAHTGTKALLVSGGNWNFNFSSGNLCSTHNTYTEWFYMNSLPSGGGIRGGTYQIFSGGSTSAVNPFYVRVDSSGVLFAGSHNPMTVVVTLGTVAANTWYDFNVKLNSCSGTDCNFTFNSATLSIATTVSTGSSCDTVEDRAGIVTGPTGGGGSFIIDDIGTPGYTGLIPVATSVTGTGNIVGFDISRDGQFIVLRDGATNAQTVRVLDGYLLAQEYTVGTQCNRANGVVAEGNYGIAYIHCNNSGTHNPDSINFASPTGLTYPFSPPCVQSQYVCDGTIDISGAGISSTDRDALSDMAAVTSGEVYATGTTNGGRQQLLSAFNIGLSESTGTIADSNMGWALRNLSPSGQTTDEHFHTSTLADLNNLQDEICSFGNLKMFRAESGVPVKGYSITLNTNPDGSDSIPNPTLVQTFTGSTSALASAGRIDCGSSTIVGATSTEITEYNLTTSSMVFTLPGLSGVISATENANGTFLAYADATRIHVINNAGTELTYAIVPGAINELEMDACAQRLYAVTTTNVYMYNITGNTTHTPATVVNGSCNVVSGITSTSSSTSSSTFGSSSNGVSFGGSSTTITNPFHASDDNPFGLNITYISTQLHISHEGAAVFIGMIFIVIFTIWLWKGTGSPIIAILGAGLGLIVATLFGFINVWVIMVVVLFLIVILGKMLFGGFTGGEES